MTGASGTDYRHMIRAGSATIIVTRSTGSNNNTYYVSQDHLGSSTAVTDSAGTLTVSESFAAYGARRGSAWQGSPTSGDWTAIANSTRRGFTGHTMVDNLSLIHMNGRLYDPMIGRFASADPFIDGIDSQGLNRYSYVGNNPLSRTDPTGYKSYKVKIDGGVSPEQEIAMANTAGFPLPKMGFSGIEWANETILAGFRGVGNGPVLTSICPHLSCADAIGFGPSTPRGSPSGSARASSMGSRGQITFECTADRPDCGAEQPQGQQIPEPCCSGAQTIAAPRGLTKLAADLGLLDGWPGNGSLEANLAGLPIIGAPTSVAAARGVSVLGHFPGYVSTAESIGARYFNVPAKIWESMTPAQQWAANTKFLDRLIARGDTVILSTPAAAARAGSWFGRELEYLAGRGYTLADDGMRMLPPGP